MMKLRAICLIGALVALPAVAKADQIQGVTASPCFTLTKGQDCAAAIVAEIATAQKTLDVQAYNFTEPSIIGAIVAAHSRGVTVRVVLDKISPSQACEGADPVRDAGIPTYIDHKPAIAHNKVMVIDGAAVITGSFNFSTNAEHANAENMIVLRSSALAHAYEDNFERRLAASETWDGTHLKAPPVCKVKPAGT